MKALPDVLEHTKTLVVTPGLCVPAMEAVLPGFRGMPEVFATAKLIAFIELTCIEALAPYLAEHERTVGTGVRVTHSAATPIGMQVTAHVRLTDHGSRRFLFQVECHDERDVVSVGEHDRALIDVERFWERVDQKRR